MMKRLRTYFAIREADRIFGSTTQFIAEFNETLSKNLPPGLARSAGASLTGWSRQGDEIISSLKLRSLRKPEKTVSLRIRVGTDQVKIGDVWVPLSDSKRIFNIIRRTVSSFFSV
jgi:hypothetical protein